MNDAQLQLDITARKHKGADTSVQAHASTPESVRKRQREDVLNLLKHLPMTTEQVSSALKIPYTSASARMSELKRDGKIIDSGVRRPTTSGRAARVMQVA